MSSRESSAKLVIEVLHVGATRPAMRWGVTYPALLCNLVLTMESFLMSRNLYSLLCCLPLHLLCVTLCLRDPRFFDLALLWMRLRWSALNGNHRIWRAASYGQLEVNLPDSGGRRTGRSARELTQFCAVLP